MATTPVNTGSGDPGAVIVDVGQITVAGEVIPKIAAVDPGTGTAILPASQADVAAIVTALGTPAQAGGNVSVSSSALPSGAATEAKQDTGNTSLASINGKLPALATDNPSADDPAVPTRPVSIKVHSCSFADVGAGLLTPEMVQIGSTGTGITVAQSGGNLTIATGTTTNAEFLARSAFSAEGSHVLRYGMVASQRIANQNLVIALADLVGTGLSYNIVSTVLVDVTLPAHGYTTRHVGRGMFLGAISGAAGVPGRYVIQSIPDANTVRFTVAGWPASGSGTLCLFGWNYHKVLYSGTTATNAAYDAQRDGWASGDTTATINTSASPGHIGHLQSDCVDATYSDSLRASSTGYQFSTRATRVENIPNQDVLLYVFVWSYNGATAPASTTTWTINFLRLEDLANAKVYLAGMTRGGSGNSLATSIIGTPSVNIGTGSLAAGTNAIGDVGVQARANATGAASRFHRVVTGTDNVNIKASAGRLIAWRIFNASAGVRYVKLHNTAGAPTIGSGVVETIGIPAGQPATGFAGDMGDGFTTGIGMSAVTGIADADTTVATASDLVIDLYYA